MPRTFTGHIPAARRPGLSLTVFPIFLTRRSTLLSLPPLSLSHTHTHDRFFALAVGGISCGPIFLLSPLEVGTTAIVVACIIILAALTYAVFNTRRILHSCTPGEVVPGTVMLLTDPVRVPALFLWHLLRRSRLFGGSRGGHDAFPSP